VAFSALSWFLYFGILESYSGVFSACTTSKQSFFHLRIDFAAADDNSSKTYESIDIFRSHILNFSNLI